MLDSCSSDRNFKMIKARIINITIFWFVIPIFFLCQVFFCSLWLFEFTKENLVHAIIWGGGLVLELSLGYVFFISKGYRKYYFIVLFVPGVIGVFLSFSAVLLALKSGVSIF